MHVENLIFKTNLAIKSVKKLLIQRQQVGSMMNGMICTLICLCKHFKKKRGAAGTVLEQL